MHAPREQQLEGLKAVLKNCTPQQFLQALDNLTKNNFMSKSQKHRLIKDMRHLLNMSYTEYLALRKR